MAPAKPVPDSRPRCYSQHVATVLLAGVDLYFRAKLEGLLTAHHLVTSDSAHRPDLVIADIARIEPNEVADAFPDIPILGYTNHTDTSGLRRAHAAGFDQVVAKSALVERAPQLVDALAS
jgi:DNA-binding NarL/FixJ family response regulator